MVGPRNVAFMNGVPEGTETGKFAGYAASEEGSVLGADSGECITIELTDEERKELYHVEWEEPRHHSTFFGLI